MFFFFFNDTATTEIYTLSLHDALPIFRPAPSFIPNGMRSKSVRDAHHWTKTSTNAPRSEEHTSELQSRLHLVCRLLLEKKKKQTPDSTTTFLVSYLFMIQRRDMSLPSA